ncbi:MAG: helix-hairpin-helix domain-containing protein [Cyclobacteriaceae bacterium]|nr:helix-hairpin-helix domain-containing protein [Cyclobacteriaceae bacterium]
MKRTFLISILLLLHINSHSQRLSGKEIDFERLVDEIFAIQDEDINYEDLYENLAQLYANPADLNLINGEQLRSIFVLNESQIQSFLNYRDEAGPFLSIYELQNIEGFTNTVIEKLIPFVTVYDPTISFNKHLWKRILEEKNNYLVMRYDRTLEEKKGYQESASPASSYAGSPDRFYTRFLTRRTGDFSIGFTTEKDAGEKSTWAPAQKQYGPDFLSFHAQVMNKGKIKNLVLGDFQAQFGQGLLLGSAFGIGKNSEAVNTVRKGNVGFLPYTSVYEASFFRGVAMTYEISKQLTLHSMYSSRWRDGAIQQDTTEEAIDFISSFQQTGLHRTPAEIANRSSVLEKNAAGILNYKYKNLNTGAMLHYTQFNIPIQRNPNVYNQFYFNGTDNTNVGAYLNYNWRNVSFFSELAHTYTRGTAIIAGMLGSITPSLDVSLLYRKFDRDYTTFYSNALAENSTTQNERGFYWGWKYLFNKKYSFSGYVDLFRFPWLKYRVYAPSDGSEWLMRFNYKPTKNIFIFLQAREESKVRNATTENNLYVTSPGIKRNYWLNADYKITPGLTFKTRAQFSNFQLSDKTTRGMVLLQDITWNHGKFSVSGRYALFDTDDYDNRLYIYEKDVWLAFSFPAYYGVGIRNYILMQYSITKKIDIWLRWAHVRYTDRETIGSGSETIYGNTKNDIKFQTRIRF